MGISFNNEIAKLYIFNSDMVIEYYAPVIHSDKAIDASSYVAENMTDDLFNKIKSIPNIVDNTNPSSRITDSSAGDRFTLAPSISTVGKSCLKTATEPFLFSVGGAGAVPFDGDYYALIICFIYDHESSGYASIGAVSKNSTTGVFSAVCIKSSALNSYKYSLSDLTITSYEKKVSDLILEPTLKYINKNETEQFSLRAEYADGSSEDVTSIATWGISRNTINEPIQELDGFTIDGTGLLTAVDPTVSSIVVSAKYGGLGAYTTIYVSGFPGIYAPGGTTGAGGGSAGGTGNFGKNEVSDSVLPPSGSVAGNASTSGMFTRYLVDSSYLDIIGDWLWADDLGLVIAKSTISLIYGDPSESLISLMSYPFDINTLPGVATRTQNLYWGGHNTGIGMIALTGQSATVDWGTINLEEYWGNFLDYEPHTRIELYLPWGTGFVSIDPNMCLPGSIQVITNIDLNKGSCVHNVIGKTTKFEAESVVIGTYAGQCSQQIPLVSSDYASKVAGVVVAATSLAIAATSAGGAVSAGINSNLEYGRTHSLPYGDVKGTMEYHKGLEAAESVAKAPYLKTQKTAARLAAGSSIAAMKRSGIISRNGSFTDGSAALGVQHPYVIVSRPSQSVPEEYGSHYGYPSNIYANLRTLKGYTEIGEIHLDNILATDEEISELDSILKGGAIF